MSTYTPIASVTLSSAQPSITFNDIPQTYTDLFVVIDATIDSTNTPSLALRFNGDSNNSYSSTILEGNGTLPYSQRYSGNRGMMQFNYYTAYYSNTKNIAILHIQNYSNSNTYKTVLSRWGKTQDNAAGTAASVGLYRANTNPITSISFAPDFGAINWASGSTFNLYGINAANSAQAKATGGDSIYRDASYWYHVFNKSGTLTPAQNLSNVDYLIIAGGGGGGNSGGTLYGTTSGGGGGGAGGFRTSAGTSGGGASAETKISLNANTAYSITVGAGGASVSYTKGSDSSISGAGLTTITSTGGGMGQTAYFGNSVKDGGSGGGGSYSGSVGNGTANQGYNGGAFGSNSESGGGGGGAGAVGTAGANGNGGGGGAGVASSITGSSVTYAGGGGGGSGYSVGGLGASGGAGGGGAGGNRNTAGTAGSANLGAGGGGAGGIDPAGSVRLGGSGGSGIIIVRYPV